jgi:CheY-like chemotaxis protein
MVMTPITVTSPRPLPLALVADADAGSREMYVESMKLANWAVVEAIDGPQALAIALARRPDVIIADTHLPGISGRELCNLLRVDLDDARNPDRADHERDDGWGSSSALRAAGASAVMLKPVPAGGAA